MASLGNGTDVILQAPTLTGMRIYLEKLAMKHLDDMFAYSSLNEFYAHMELKPHRSMADTEKYLEKLLNRVRGGNALYWAICMNTSGRMIGTLGFVDIDCDKKTSQVGYGVSPIYWNQGVFKESLQLALHHGFQALGLEHICALTMAGNLPSTKGLRRLGFHQKKIVKAYYFKNDGTRCDALLFERHRADWKNIPGVQP
jgi:RimJ/RimL family protein N-acetyltransferase